MCKIIPIDIFAMLRTALNNNTTECILGFTNIEMYECYSYMTLGNSIQILKKIQLIKHCFEIETNKTSTN